MNHTTNPLPTLEPYCSGSAKAMVSTDSQGRQIWYSYQTPVAFRAGGALHVRYNDFSQTTGKHLNSIDGGGTEAKARRYTRDLFNAALVEAFKEPDQWPNGTWHTHVVNGAIVRCYGCEAQGGPTNGTSRKT